LTGGAHTSRWQNGKERGAIAMGSEKSVAHPTVAAPVARLRLHLYSSF